MFASSSSGPSKLPAPPPAERYYALKGQQYEHVKDIQLPPKLEHYCNILVDTAERLGIDDVSFTSYSSAIDRLDEEELTTARSLIHMRRTEDELTHYLLSTLHEDHLIDEWSQLLQSHPTSNATVHTLERQKAALTSKAKEYQRELDELTANMPEPPPLTITELVEFRKQLKKQEQVLKEKRAKVEAFHGLPPNINLARHALQEARDKQMELLQLRERLLSKMVDGVN